MNGRNKRFGITMTLKKLITIAVAVVVFFITALIISMVMYKKASDTRIKAQNSEYQSYIIAKEVAYVSSQLTRLARSYVATGDRQYQDQYNALLDWRSGKTPRPADVVDIHPGKTLSQIDIMRELEFSEEELGYLAQATQLSNQLVALEVQAMTSVSKSRIEPGAISPKPSEDYKQFALRILYDDNYHGELTKIAQPISTFLTSLIERKQVELDQAKQNAGKWLMVTYIMQFLFVLALLGVAWMVMKYVVARLGCFPNVLEDEVRRIGSGDLTDNTSISIKDKTSVFAILRNTVGDISALVKDISDIGNDLSSTSSQSFSSATSMQHNIKHEKDETDMVSNSINEMEQTVEQVEEHAKKTLEASQSASDETQRGKALMEKTANAIESLASKINDISIAIEDTGKQSNEIGTVLDVIRGIAEQTNLLALNAAIEAARAGEQGRGFAVVADEVRSLAVKTQESTANIETMITSLQQSTSNAIDEMNTCKDEALNSVDQAAEADQSLTKILNEVNQINEMNNEIASVSEKQSKMTQDFGKNVSTLNQMSDSNVAAADQVASASEQLSEMAANLQQAVARFKI